MVPTPPAPDAASNVTGTLAELERKLRELEQELTSLGRHASPSDTTPQITRPLGGRLIDEAAELREPPREPRAEAPAYVPPSRGLSDTQLAGLAELRRFGARLEQFSRELTEDYEQVLERALTQLAGTTPAPPTPDETLFEGPVELGVGPFYDIGSLSLFEQRIAGLHNAYDVAVRRFEASHAVIDLRLNQPVALVRELRSVLDNDFSVVEIDGARLMLTFDDV